MPSFGKLATQAGKRIKKQAEYYAENKGEMTNMGPATRGKVNAAMPSTAVTRTGNAPAPPRGADLGNDAKNIKIRQRYEDIPEARVTHPAAAASKKKKKFGFF